MQGLGVPGDMAGWQRDGPRPSGLLGSPSGDSKVVGNSEGPMAAQGPPVSMALCGLSGASVLTRLCGPRVASWESTPPLRPNQVRSLPMERAGLPPAQAQPAERLQLRDLTGKPNRDRAVTFGGGMVDAEGGGSPPPCLPRPCLPALCGEPDPPLWPPVPGSPRVPAAPSCCSGREAVLAACTCCGAEAKGLSCGCWTWRRHRGPRIPPAFSFRDLFDTLPPSWSSSH